MANNPPGLAFHSGVAYIVDNDTLPTPSNLKLVQSASLDIKATSKELFGQNVFAQAIGISQFKVTGKLKFADYQGRVIRDFLNYAPNNTEMAAGQTLIATGEAHTPSGTSQAVTFASGFVQDLGVRYSASGIPLTSAASGTIAVGTYYLGTGGVYNFNASDEVALLFDYAYTTTLGDTVTLTNTLAGAANTRQVVMGSSYNGLETNFLLYAVVETDLKLYDAKLGDFSMPEVDFSAQTNSAGNIGIVSVPVTS